MPAVLAIRADPAAPAASVIVALMKEAGIAKWPAAISKALGSTSATWAFAQSRAGKVTLIEPGGYLAGLAAFEIPDDAKRYFMVECQPYSLPQVAPRPFLVEASEDPEAVKTAIRERLAGVWGEPYKGDFKVVVKNPPGVDFKGEKFVIGGIPEFKASPIYAFIGETAIQVTINADEMRPDKGYRTDRPITTVSQAARGDELQDLIREVGSTVVLDSHNLWKCTRCDHSVQATKSFTVWSVPPLLVIHLARFGEAGFAKNDRFVHFPMELDMAPFVAGPQRENPMKYQLMGTICHLGKHLLAGGHYKAFVKHRTLGEWFEINDAIISKASPGMLQTKDAYVLFYELAPPV
jgi:hypothetical protein